MSADLKGFFTNYIDKKPIFQNKSILQSAYIPDTVTYRDDQIVEVANVLAPCLRLERPSNLFVYGRTGTGKTLVIKKVINEITQTAKENNIAVSIIYLNCKLKKVADTEYRLIAQLCRELGKEMPATGLPTDEIYSAFYNLIDLKKQVIIIVLDELDQLVSKTGSDILYNLTRINSEFKHSQLSLVGISNDLIFIDSLDPRVKSSLSEEELVFPSYNALQIQSILKNRVSIAFNEGIVEEGVIEKCAAYAARDHGDARRALELMRVAGEIAERQNDKTVSLNHLDLAEKKIERDSISDIVLTQPKQHQLVLYTIIVLLSKKSDLYTGDVYESYKSLCKALSQPLLTQRRVSDIICEFDMLGLISAKAISRGRYGRTREITISISPQIEQRVIKILKESLNLDTEE